MTLRSQTLRRACHCAVNEHTAESKYIFCRSLDSFKGRREMYNNQGRGSVSIKCWLSGITRSQISKKTWKIQNEDKRYHDTLPLKRCTVWGINVHEDCIMHMPMMHICSKKDSLISRCWHWLESENWWTISPQFSAKLISSGWVNTYYYSWYIR